MAQPTTFPTLSLSSDLICEYHLAVLYCALVMEAQVPTGQAERSFSSGAVGLSWVSC